MYKLVALESHSTINQRATQVSKHKAKRKCEGALKRRVEVQGDMGCNTHAETMKCEPKCRSRAQLGKPRHKSSNAGGRTQNDEFY